MSSATRAACARRRRAIVVSVAITCATGGCAVALSPEVMVPSPPVTAARTEKTITVAQVTTEGEASTAALDPAEQFKVADEQFRVALVKALEASGMFRRVTSAGRGDYQLLARIVAQQSQRAGFLTVTSSFVANYRLREEESGREVWRETIVTHETAEGRPFSEGVPGAGKKALAAAVRRNIADMLEKLARGVQ